MQKEVISFNQGTKKASMYSNGSQQANMYYTISRRKEGDLQRKNENLQIVKESMLSFGQYPKEEKGKKEKGKPCFSEYVKEASQCHILEAP